MIKKDTYQVLASNLKAAMERKFDGEVNQTALAKLSGVSQKTISNILSGLKTDPGTQTPPPSTTLVKLEMLAEALDINLWELLHPNPSAISQQESDHVLAGSSDIGSVVRLISLYEQATDDGRVFILDSAEIAEKIPASRGGRTGGNQSK